MGKAQRTSLRLPMASRVTTRTLRVFAFNPFRTPPADLEPELWSEMVPKIGETVQNEQPAIGGSDCLGFE